MTATSTASGWQPVELAALALAATPNSTPDRRALIAAIAHGRRIGHALVANAGKQHDLGAMLYRQVYAASTTSLTRSE